LKYGLGIDAELISLSTTLTTNSCKRIAQVVSSAIVAFGFARIKFRGITFWFTSIASKKMRSTMHPFFYRDPP